MSDDGTNSTLEELINGNIISQAGVLEIVQNDEGIDMEDRIEKVRNVLATILNSK